MKNRAQGRTKCFLVLLAMLSLLLPSLAAADDTVRITGCYSDLEYVAESGDLVGFEFFIVYSGQGYYLFYQESVGEPDTPQLLPVKVDGNKISFKLQSDPSDYGAFKGTISADGLTGKFMNADYPVELQRKESYWGGKTEELRIAGCYSNMEYSEDSGDLTGYELFIVYARDRYYILYQASAGEPAAPRLFSVAAEDALKNAAISFMLPPHDPQPGEFTAAITATGLSGTFSGTGERIELKRKDSYWQ